MFQSKFLIKNIKKFFRNFKKKNYLFNKDLFKLIYKKKYEIVKKFLFINKFEKKLKLEKKYILKIKIIYRKFFIKINKNFKLIILKIPNIIHKITSSKNKLINIKIFKNNLFFLKKKIFNLKTSSKVSGKGFSFISPPYSILYNNLENIIFNIHLNENNFKYIKVPNILKFKSFINSGQIPKFIKKLFIIKNKKKVKYLIPTSEISLINFMINKKLNSKYIPIKLFSKTECFRNENLSYGSFNKSIIKQKQFGKIELLKFVDNKNSYKYLKELVKNVEKIIKIFKISYRVIEVSKKNLSYISTKTFDLEVWIPSINNFCEISSCSNTENYQSLRSNIKYIKKNKNVEYFSILNGSGPAIGRFFLSLIENYNIKKINEKIFKIKKKILFS